MDTLYSVEGGLGFGDSGKSFKAHCREQDADKGVLINVSSKIDVSGPLGNSFYSLLINCLWNNFQNET